MTPIEKTITALTGGSENKTQFNSPLIYTVGRENGMTCREVQLTFINETCRVARGLYDVRLYNQENVAPAQTERRVVASRTKRVKPTVSVLADLSENRQPTTREPGIDHQQKTFADVEEVFIPDVDPTFVPWGEYNDIRKIITSGLFCPTVISGLSGNGKTMMVEQACARERREYVRIQISPESDESDLIGGFRLFNGETVFYKGPVIKAMERGAILLIDELDRGSNKIMCLQGVLEGKPILIKKIGQVIVPAHGFTIFATANTKGRGSEDGRFSAANIIDEAFIERFVVTVDQPYPGAVIEKSIIAKHCTSLGVTDIEFVDKLVAWAQVIRKTYSEGGVEECISTRRLCHIIKTHSIFNDRHKSISKCIARFDEETKSAFSDLYTKIDSQPINDSLGFESSMVQS